MIDILTAVFGQLLSIVETVLTYPLAQLSELSSNVL